jgi:isoleucyl-tRNA synthetase
MVVVKDIVEAASNARQKAKRKLRWPLKKLVIETKDENVKKAVGMLEEIVKSQCNVKSVEVVEEFQKEVAFKPNFKVIGPLFKDRAKDFARYISELKEIPEVINFEGIEINGSEAVIVEYSLPEGYEYSEFLKGNVYIYKELDEDLRKEAYAREVIRRIQEMRKELDLDVEEFIESYVEMDSELISGWEEYIMNETRSKKLEFGEVEGYIREWDVEGMKIRIGIKRCSSKSG